MNEEIQELISQKLEEKKEGITASEISQRIGRGYWKILDILENMRKEGAVESEKRGAFKYWKINKQMRKK